MREEIAAFDRLDYARTISIGRNVVKAEPANGWAHYYLAGAYMKQLRGDEAYAEYKTVVRVTADPQLRHFAETAIAALEHQRDNDVIASSVPAAGAAAIASTGPPSVSLKKAEQQRDEKLRLLQAELDIAMRNVDEGARLGAAKINADLNLDLMNLSRGVRRSGGDFILLRKALQDEAASRIESIRISTQHERDAIQAEFRRRDADLRRLVPNEISQLQPGSASGNQLTAIGTDLYVRNYVNYGGGDSAPPPAIELRATQATFKWAPVSIKGSSH
jgi:hypothetical protein